MSKNALKQWMAERCVSLPVTVFVDLADALEALSRTQRRMAIRLRKTEPVVHNRMMKLGRILATVARELRTFAKPD